MMMKLKMYDTKLNSDDTLEDNGNNENVKNYIEIDVRDNVGCNFVFL